MQQYYVGFYGRPATQDELDEWNARFEEDAPDFSAIRAEFAAESPYAEYAEAAETTGEYDDLVNFIYQNLFNRDAEAEGQAWYVARLEDGTFTVEDIVSRIADGAQNNDIDAMAYRVAAAEYVTANLGDRDLFEEVDGVGVYDVMALVTADPDSLDEAVEAFEVWAGETEPVDPDPEVGETIPLTVGYDNLTGTENDDTFTAAPRANDSGQIANSLNSGDELDGNGGYNTLDAAVISDYSLGSGGLFGGGTTPIRPITENIQNVKINALLEDNYSISGPNGDVVVQAGVVINAEAMEGVESWTSSQSQGNLILQNLTTHANAPNTADVTIRMDHTGNNDGMWSESDFKALFDENHLLAGEDVTSSQANYWLLDQDGEEAVPTEPLANIDRDGVQFSLDGEDFTVRPDDQVALEADTWEEYAQYLRDEIARMIEEEGADRLESIEVYVDDNMIRQTYNDAGDLVDVSAIVLEDTAGGTFSDLGFTIPRDLSGEFNVFGRFNTEAAEVFAEDRTATVELEKVGSGGDGGELIVTGMHKDAGKGIEVMDVYIRNAPKSR